ncbi:MULTISPECIES: hypothetical protein [Morganellaceae]|uniref:Photorhabdus luminescens subsp. laumondii TTO1 complete genome segment 4/17 n=2 Tax=Morganellaceae TaxID=1903414 RepID=Q7N7K3_PHOLL|nr:MULTISPECIES: hypothetical protein [Morganellaceae]AWK43334.1 hypothetical protein A4R40_18450 [Photorhabdus laumondii subsp. laumondii]CAE13436.1 unnamed protein product [Photorhabdus laumondii subsp. laumondii TTO1]
MASTGMSKEPATANRAQPVQRGWGGGKSMSGGRRPICLQGCWPDVGTAAKEELRVADVRLSRLEHKAQPCAPHPPMLTRGGARHNANYTH